MMERLLNYVILPNTKTESVLYTVDVVGILMTALWVIDLKELLSIYILAITALSITITLGVKLYNLITHNNKNKKI